MRVAIVEEPDQVTALAHPVRVAVLDALREPGSAAGVARAALDAVERTDDA